jgi:hypothetical protein
VDRSNLKLILGALPAFALTAALSSCSDTPADVDEDRELTEAEAIALAGELGLESLAFGWGRSGVAAPDGAATRTAEVVSVTYSLTRPCILGGSVDSSGTITVETDAQVGLSIIDIAATDVHHACVFLANGTRVAITGDPDVTTTVHAASLAGEPQGTQSVGVLGGLLFETSDGRSGRCVVDVLVEVDPASAYQSTRGRICGFTFDVTVQG